MFHRRRRALTAAAIVLACAGSAGVGLVKAMGPHGPFRTVSARKAAPVAAEAAQPLATNATEEAKPILADYRPPDRDEVSRAYLNVSAVYKTEGLSGVVRQTIDCFSGLKSNPSYQTLDYCVALDIYGEAVQRKLADGQAVPQGSFFGGLSGRDFTAAKEVLGPDGDAGARLLDDRRLAGEVSQAGPAAAAESVKRAAVANALVRERAAQQQAAADAAVTATQLAAQKAAERMALAKAQLAPQAASQPAPRAAPKSAPPVQLATAAALPAPTRAAAPVQAPARAQIVARAAPAPMVKPAPIRVAAQSAPSRPAARPVKPTPVKVAARPAPRPAAHVTKAVAKAPAKPVTRPALVRAVAPLKASQARPSHATAKLSRASFDRRETLSRTRHTPVRPVRAAYHAPAHRAAPAKASLPAPLRALSRFFQRVTHSAKPARGPTRTLAATSAPGRPAHPSAIRIVAVGRPHAADRRAEPGSWVDCRRPRGGQEAKLCQAAGDGDGTLGGQMRQASRGSRARSVEDPW